MRLLVFSDLHLEFPQQMKTNTLPPMPADDQFDVVIAAGDIGYAMEAVKRLRKLFPNHRVLFVPGNHEYYKGSYGHICKLYEEASDDHVTILNPGTVTIDGYKFIGATMWSDLRLDGYDPLPVSRVENAISDFTLIYGFTGFDMLKIHQQELEFVESELSKQKNDKTVVITHFVPTQECIHERFNGAWLNPYFTNDHNHLFEQHEYALHVFGHTHDRYDITDGISGTRVVGNPRGYPNENPGFEWKVVEV